MKQRYRKPKTNNTVELMQKFADGVTNPLLRIGEQNTFNATTYAPSYVSLNRQLLEWCYQTSWICGMAVDVLANDMTREGIDVKLENTALIDPINEAIEDNAVFDKLEEAIKWSRLYGGAIAVILIDGQEMSAPLTSIPKGSFKGLYVFDRWQLSPNETDLVQELGENFGKPRYYQVVNDKSEIEIGQKIHYSRVLRFEGRRLPYYLRLSYQGWGASVIEPIFEKIKGFDLATQGATQLLSKAYLRFYRVKGLRQILTNDIARKGFLAQMDVIRQFQGTEGLTLGDSEDDFQTLSYTFTGIPEIMLQLGQQISGALGIPLVRLFGQSPVGLNATGESDIRNYYDQVKNLQRSTLRSAIKRLLNIVYQSVTGQEPPNNLSFDFKSLWQTSLVEKSQVASQTLTAIKDAYAEGLIDLPTALKELKAQSDTIGLFGSIRDEDIAEAQRQEELENSVSYAYEPESEKPNNPTPADKNQQA